MGKIKWKLRNVVLSSLLFFLCFNLLGQKKEVKIIAKKITDNIYMLQGQGGNIGLFIGDKSVFMIDDQFAPLTNKILAKVKEISDKPIKYLVNTHWHGDHTGGNENMRKHDVLIFSQENVRKRMSTDQKVRGRLKKASPKEALPVITFTNEMNFHIDGEDILVSHVHNAHTDGDSHIYFLNSNVIHMGDTYFQGKFPFIDLDSGGSINGYIASIDKVLLMSNDKTVIIPGHRGLSTKEELKVYRKMLITLRDRVLKNIEKGKTLTEVSNDEDITKEYKEEYGGWFISAKEMRETIYKSLKQ
ncbi:MBL fold metallo-hydrolase [Tenacibaculum aiptasiae]|uniref:MBL fold metallo-hydrolase n=1 Tax=Tenacibaculum aiptasiae TaxID=426481 RepID=A0A7J5AL82_9FLAO|nr:MBL fold metallo-hydrolase [Tenacibaculum aiptasiae]KAB1158362.1 MBL fold metallo-hydrolase [Tenacibaculum aiptasiae]